jgi:EAL domain-containing protein (putative c-di-GMP-specific phosphodiesterase class I)
MQTQLMQSVQPGVPWLERFTASNDAPERTPIQSLPFTIGRTDASDLQVDSSRVSREHAVIVREGNAFRIRDLDSTNGTFVNGERIEEAVLGDGDLVVIADAEFTFFGNAGQTAERHCVTQAMTHTVRPPTGSGADQILGIRRLQERLLHRGMLPRLDPILDLERGAVFAFRTEPQSQAESVQWGESSGGAMAASRLQLQAKQLYRTLAVEAFLNLGHDAQLLVDLSRSELDRDRALEAHLLRLSFLVGPTRLIVGLPATVVADDPRARALRERLKSKHIDVAYADFLGGKAQLDQLADAAPDYLLLDPKVTNDIASSPRQTRQLATLAEAAEEVDCRLIATGLRQREDEDACFKLGLRLVATDRRARPASTSAVAQLLQKVDDRMACLT